MAAPILDESTDATAETPPTGLLAIRGLGGLAVLGSVIALAVWAATGGRGGAGAVTGFAWVHGVLFALVGFLLWRPFAAAALRRGPEPRPGPYARRVLLRIVPAWWIAVLAALLFAPSIDRTMPTDAFSPVPAGTTSVPLADLLRHLSLTQVYSSDAMSSPLSFGWIVAAVAAFVLITPLLARRSAIGSDRSERLRRQVRIVVGLAVLALLWRVGLVAFLGGWDGASGWARAARLWLPAHLDLFAIGMAAAVLSIEIEDGGTAARVGSRLRRLLEVGGGAPAMVGGAILLLILGALLGPTPDRLLPGPVPEIALHVGIAAATIAIVGPVLLTGDPRRLVGGVLASPVLDGLGRLAYGLLLWAPIVLVRWVSAPAAGEPAPARRAGQLFAVPILPTLAFVLIGSVGAALLSLLLVQRPAESRVRRPIGRFAGTMWTVSLLSFLSRIWAMGVVTSKNPGNGDPFFYHAQANMLADRVGFGEPIRWLTEGRFVPSAIHPPIYTLWLTPSSVLGSRGYLAHKTMGAIAGVLVVVVAGLLARRLAGDRAGLIAAVIVAIYPNLWLIDGTLWSEGLYTATIGLALLMAYRWRDRPSLATAAALGAACGVAILTRGEALLLLPLVCLPLAFGRRREVADWFRHLLVMGLAAGLLLTPWVIRNQIRFGEFVAVSTNSEEVLFYANCEDVYAGESMGFWSFGCQERVRQERVAEGLPPDPAGNEAQRARAWGEMGRRYALDHRDRLPAVAVARVARAWDLRYSDHNVLALIIEGRPRPWATAGLWIYRTVGVLGVAGLVVLRRRREMIWPLLSTIAMVTIIAVYAYGHVRFRTAGDLVLILGAAVALDTIVPRRGSAEA